MKNEECKACKFLYLLLNVSHSRENIINKKWDLFQLIKLDNYLYKFYMFKKLLNIVRENSLQWLFAIFFRECLRRKRTEVVMSIWKHYRKYKRMPEKKHKRSTEWLDLKLTYSKLSIYCITECIRFKLFTYIMDEPGKQITWNTTFIPWNHS